MRRPFKGTLYYEWQIGPVVFQIRRRNPERQWTGIGLSGYGRWFNVWRDPYWRRT